MKNKKNRLSQKPTHKPMPRTESPKSSVSKSSEPTSKAVEPLLSIAAEPDSAEPLLAEVQSFLAKRSELAKRLKEEIAATELRLEQLRKTAASLMSEKSLPVAKEKKPKKARLAVASDATQPEPTSDGSEQTRLPD
jgi:hypothetical protein